MFTAGVVLIVVGILTIIGSLIGALLSMKSLVNGDDGGFGSFVNGQIGMVVGTGMGVLGVLICLYAAFSSLA